MKSVLTRGLVAAAVVGGAMFAPAAMADHKDGHPAPPGQACNDLDPGPARGECARAAAAANKEDRKG